MAALRFKPRTYVYTPQFWKRMRVQPVHTPLYSAFIYDAAALPREAQMFSYGVGGTVASNVATATTATLLHTSLAQPGGVLPSPKLFVVTGIRVVPSQLNSGFSDLITDTAFASINVSTFVGVADINVLEDLIRIVYGTVLKVFIGTRDDQIGPTPLFPANTGIEGEMAEAIVSGASATGNLTQRRSAATVYNAGKAFILDRWPTLIPPQQNFSATLVAPQATTPTLGAARTVWCVFDGVLGRETAPAGG